MSAPRSRPKRVTQLDALALDTEVENIACGGVKEALSKFPTFSYESIRPEVELAVSVCLALAAAKQRIGFGGKLQNLVLVASLLPQNTGGASKAESGSSSVTVARPSSTTTTATSSITSTRATPIGARRFVAGAVTAAVTRYLVARSGAAVALLSRLGVSRGSTESVLQVLELAGRTLSLLNTLLFLVQGRYRTLVERAFGHSLDHASPSPRRLASFEFLARHVAWQAVAEFVTAALAMVDVARLGRTAWRFIVGPDTHVGDVAGAPDGSCVLCGAEPAVTPYTPLCRHVTCCYFCLAVKLETESGFQCPDCSTTSTQCVPLYRVDEGDALQ